MKRKRVYISGPMSGLSREYYMKCFAERERQLRMVHPDWRIVNPTKLAPCRWPWLYRLLGYRLTLAYDLWHLRRCTHICMMTAWRYSRGARLEHLKAREWGIEIITRKTYKNY